MEELKVLGLLPKLKNIKKEKLSLSEEDELILYNYWKVYDIRKKCHLSYRLYKNMIVYFRSLTLHSIHNSCMIMTPKIIEKYGNS